jgi:diaminopimelate epimerase
MHIYNADGSEAEMCGNASRCIGKYVYEKGLTAKREILLETLSGIKILKLNVENEKVISVTVDMGEPMVGERDVTVEAKGEKFRGSKVSMGNPHFVIFTDAVEKIPLSEVGPVIEHDAKFPEGTNVEFVEINGYDEVRVRVWGTRFRHHDGLWYRFVCRGCGLRDLRTMWTKGGRDDGRRAIGRGMGCREPSRDDDRTCGICV